MTRILRWSAFSLVFTSVVVLLFDRIEVMSIARIDATVYTLLGLVLSILLVFRTNTAYDRWWEVI